MALPQTLNRYSYTINNPLTYIDPSGHIIPFLAAAVGIIRAAVTVYTVVTTVQDIKKAIDDPTSKNILIAGANFIDPSPGNKGAKTILHLVDDAGEQAAKQGMSTNKILETLQTAKRDKKGGYILDPNCLTDIGLVETKDIDMSKLSHFTDHYRLSTEGGWSWETKYFDDKGDLLYITHQVTDEDGIIIHFDFDFVKLESGQELYKLSG